MSQFYDQDNVRRIEVLENEVNDLRKQLAAVALELAFALDRNANLEAKLRDIVGICASAVVAAPLVLVEGPTGGEGE